MITPPGKERAGLYAFYAFVSFTPVGLYLFFLLIVSGIGCDVIVTLPALSSLLFHYVLVTFLRKGGQLRLTSVLFVVVLLYLTVVSFNVENLKCI